MTQWYFADAAHVQRGPVDPEVLLAHYAAGEITPDTLVWREGLGQWQPLSTVAVELGLQSGAEVETTVASDLPTAWVPADGHSTAVGVSAPWVQYAGFWRRAAASIIDSFAIGLLALPITLPLGMAAGMALGHGQEDAGGMLAGWLIMQLLVQLFALLVTVTYMTCFHASRLMATPGKLAVGIKVVRSDGQRLTFGRSLGRGFAYYLSILSLYIGLLMAAFTRRKQGLHDLVCDTIVVDRWAFTDTPERQKRGLDVVSIVVLSLYGLLLLLAVLLVIGVLAIGLAGHGH